MIVNAWTSEQTAADARPDACPEWCTEHYAAEGGARNHSSAQRTITVGGADTGATLPLNAWLERRDWPDGTTETVGVVSRLLEDVELSAEQLRDFAGHLLAIADEVAQAAAELPPSRVTRAKVTVHQPEEGGDIRLSVSLPTTTDTVFLSPAGAQALGLQLTTAARQHGRPAREGR